MRGHRGQGKARSGTATLPSVLALLGALVALLAVPVAASASGPPGTLDQSQTAANDAYWSFFGGEVEAQTFTAGITGDLDHVDLLLFAPCEQLGDQCIPRSDDCDPGPLTVEIRTTSGGTPTSTVLATATVPSSRVSTSPSYVTVPFTERPPSVAGTQYAIVLSAPDASSECQYAWLESSLNPYARGQEWHSLDYGSTWQEDREFDHNFKTYVVEDSAAVCTITGTSGNDIIRGTPGDDVICAVGGNDIVYGGGGNDAIYGGRGNDILRGEGGNDRLSGGDGDDQVIGGEGNDRLSGGPGRDVLSGQDGRDYLNTRDNVRGNDIANGGAGADSCEIDRRDTRTSC